MQSIRSRNMIVMMIAMMIMMGFDVEVFFGVFRSFFLLLYYVATVGLT